MFSDLRRASGLESVDDVGHCSLGEPELGGDSADGGGRCWSRRLEGGSLALLVSRLLLPLWECVDELGSSAHPIPNRSVEKAIAKTEGGVICE